MRSELIKSLLDKVPGKKTFGLYRFLPFFFVLGAALEFSMINWEVNNSVNFYNTYKKRRAEDIAKFMNEAHVQTIQSLIRLIMPAGVTWSQYIRFTSVAMLTMFAGSQLVHVIYKPLDDINQYIEVEIQKIKSDPNLVIFVMM